MPLKLIPPRQGYSPNYRIRGTVHGRYVNETTGTADKALAEAFRLKREATLLDVGEFDPLIPARRMPQSRSKLPNYGSLPSGTLVSLYAMHCSGCYKIGIASDPRRRRASLQSANPFEVSLVLTRTVRYECAHLAEAAVHRALEPHYVRGEWFRCELTQIKQAVTHAIAEAESVLPPYWRSRSDKPLIDKAMNESTPEPAMSEAATSAALQALRTRRRGR